jgi:3'(2'), 5'-bisphosphate nucleotidase
MIMQLIPCLTQLCWEASDAIMAYYKKPIDYHMKEDGSPLSKADIASHTTITNKLKQLTPHIPIISEESCEKFDTKKSAKQFWLVDPLDGTKEFINKNGEFTVNIALIENKFPALGLVCCPALDKLYVGVTDGPCYKINRQGKKTDVSIDTPIDEALIVITSRSHNDDDAMMRFLKDKKVKAFMSAGSSLKFCLLAEGKAHLYPRLGRTMEWDTAAGHAVLLAAGGKVESLDKTPLVYAKTNLENPHFVAHIKA